MQKDSAKRNAEVGLTEAAITWFGLAGAVVIAFGMWHAQRQFRRPESKT